MEEMIYQPQHTNYQVLKNDTYEGYEYYVMSVGTHPCTYIILDENHCLHGEDYECLDQMFYCHGGFTYSSNTLADSHKTYISTEEGKWVIGYDYGHSDDWTGLLSDELNSSLGNKKWTTPELINDVEEVILQLVRSL